ncbi:hypothetical protein T4D_15961 [Trichinella pseudospiralis]|uniref:Uncharacterized protein n=1 Tax=Trichinella pseudospiralis TaxID=6337 RepID=A0A0V1FDC7_TRIPS|nr:hypothetical protein T4D_15961 [Trichinella pseudospiralis]
MENMPLLAPTLDQSANNLRQDASVRDSFSVHQGFGFFTFSKSGICKLRANKIIQIVFTNAIKSTSSIFPLFLLRLHA